MEPIINPWLVYAAEKCESVAFLSLLIVCFGITISFIWFLIYTAGGTALKPPKWLVTISIIGAILLTLLPSQKTILTMVTLQYITPSNVTFIGETAEDVVDYIIDKIEDFMNEED